MTRMNDIPTGTAHPADLLSAFNVPGNMFNPLETFSQAWQSMQTASPFPSTMSVADLEKRIAELRTVEQWLTLNLGMLRTSIQTLEVQKGTLQALGNLSAMMSPEALQAAMGAGAGPGGPHPAGPVSGTTGGMASSTAFAGSTRMDAASQLSQQWWEMLQTQLGQFSGMAGLRPDARGPKAESTPAGPTSPTDPTGPADPDEAASPTGAAAPGRSTRRARAGRTGAAAAGTTPASSAAPAGAGAGATAHSHSSRRSSGPKAQEP